LDPPTNTPQRTQSQQPQLSDLERTPGLRQPISDDTRHPVKSEGASVYFSRTGNLAGLSVEQQSQKLSEAMLSVGPGKVLLLEASGPAGGSYVEELRRALPKALEMVPPDKRPEIRFFVSDGRPVIRAPEDPNAEPSLSAPKQERNAFADYLIALNREKPGSGMVDRDSSIAGVDRGIPNWGNPKVVDYFMRERIEPAIALAKEFGIKSIVLDDHIGITPDNPQKGIDTMSSFKRANGLDPRDRSSDAAVQEIITGVYRQGLQRIKDAGLEAGFSSAAEPGRNTDNGLTGSLKYGIRTNSLASLTDTIEIQGYRNDAKTVKGMTDSLLESIRGNFGQYVEVKEIKVALVTRANGKNLSEQTLIEQQAAIDTFEKQINALYRSQNKEPPKVTTSLWPYQEFYK
jgi:hypothetical protein